MEIIKFNGKRIHNTIINKEREYGNRLIKLLSRTDVVLVKILVGDCVIMFACTLVLPVQL